jgi:hypothetical protein
MPDSFIAIVGHAALPHVLKSSPQTWIYARNLNYSLDEMIWAPTEEFLQRPGGGLRKQRLIVVREF